MVKEPSEYSGSSYACNALGIEAELQTSHDFYLALSRTKSEILESYRELFKAHVGVALKEITKGINKGLSDRGGIEGKAGNR